MISNTYRHSTQWVAASPIMYAWHTRGFMRAKSVRPELKNWVNVQVGRHSENTVLYLRTTHHPNEVLLLPYREVNKDLTPVGKPKITSCDIHSSCYVETCSKDKSIGVCVVVGDTYIRLHPVLVIFLQWMVPGVKLSTIKMNGPATDSASWGIIDRLDVREGTSAK
jgi:hypothetical protein